MADRSNYVDIVFRNGLKEFEVLPPSDVWGNIRPVIRKRQRSLIILRIAAVAAILLSLSVFSFWLTREFSKDFNGPAISLNQEFIPAGYYIAKQQPVSTHLFENQVRTSQTERTVSINEKHSSELIHIKMPSPGLFFTNNKESKLQKGIEPVISTGVIISSSNSEGYENLSLNPGNYLTENTEYGVNRWTISALASPNYFSSVSFGKNDASNDLVNGEKPTTSYTGGMAFSYNVNKRISVQSGIYYSSIGQKVTGISSFSGFLNYYDVKGSSEFSIQTSSGMIVSTNNDIYLHDNTAARVLTKYTIDSFDPTKADLTYLNNYVTQNFNYLEIPVLLKYKAIDRKIDLNLIGGISYNMLVGNSAFAYVSGVKQSIGKTEGLSPVNFSSSLGLGLEYNLSEKTSLHLEPTFRYYLTPLGGLVGSSIHPYSFGFFSGLSYKF